jgi:RNA polymerase sigma-70 factor (ECF subfamily)
VTVHDQDRLASRFEENRPHLRSVAYRMLGSLAEADDAVQEAWLRLGRADASEIENLGGWLTTVVSRVCLDLLRSRKSRGEETLELHGLELLTGNTDAVDPEHEAMMADSVGLALLVVLRALGPAERVAFVLHDMYSLPFEEVAAIVGRTPTAARQLASRARRRLQGAPLVSAAELDRQREVVDAFLAAQRNGDFDALVAVLDPDVVVRIDPSAVPAGAPTEVRGAQTWAKGAVAFSRFARFNRPALVDGTVGVIVAPRGRLFRALRFSFKGGKIAQVHVVADPQRLRQLEVGVLDR